MIQLNSYEQFREEYDTARKRIGKLVSNCVFAKKIIEDHLIVGRAYIESQDCGIIVLLEDEVPGFYTLIYYLDSLESLTVPDFDRPVLIDLVGRDGDSKADETGHILLDKGFVKIAKNYQIQCPVKSCEDDLSELIDELAAKGYRMETSFSEKQREEIAGLWKRWLKPTDVPKSHYIDLENNTGKIVCAINDEGDVCGVIWWSVSGKTCEIRHAVTREQDRKHGIALLLEKYTVLLASQAGCSSVFSFIDVNNAPSFRVCYRAGFVRTDRYTEQYCKTAD